MTHTTPPALHTDHNLSLLQHAELDGLRNTPLQTTVHILLPDGHVEIGLALREEEGVDTSVEMRVLDSSQ